MATVVWDSYPRRLGNGAAQSGIMGGGLLAAEFTLRDTQGIIHAVLNEIGGFRIQPYFIVDSLGVAQKVV